MNPARTNSIERRLRLPVELRFWRLSAWSLLALLASACTIVQAPAPPAEPAPAVLDGPAIRDGVRVEEEARAAARLVREGEAHLADGRYEEARERAREVEAVYPEAEGSAQALWLRARASRQLQDWEDADDAASRYADLLPSDAARYGEAILLRAEVRHGGDLPGGVEALFAVPESASEEVLGGAESLARTWAGEFDTSTLRDLIEEAPEHARLTSAFLAELALRRHLAGDEGEARELAQSVLDRATQGESAELARGILAGEVDEDVAVAAVLGTILPGTGSPSVQQLSGQIRDGVEVALVVEEGRFARPVRLVPVEDQGDLSNVIRGLQSLEQQGAAGVVGPLLDPLVAAAADSRTGTIPILSPTARMLPQGTPGVFSLTSVDPEAGRALADLVLNEGIRSAVLLHTSSQEMVEEAAWFREAYEAGGGTITRTLGYAPGTAGFAEPLSEVARLAPRGLVLLLPQDDVELLAPQLAYYGVDDGDVTIFGNESWTSDQVLQDVQPRHTNGVLAVTTRTLDGDFGPGWDEFVVAYEEHFQRTLRSPVPALGYDAARLLLAAAREGGGTPAGTLAALERIQDFPGATGLLSISDGAIHRAYTPVRIENRQLIPLAR